MQDQVQQQLYIFLLQGTTVEVSLLPQRFHFQADWPVVEWKAMRKVVHSDHQVIILNLIAVMMLYLTIVLTIIILKARPL